VYTIYNDKGFYQESAMWERLTDFASRCCTAIALTIRLIGSLPAFALIAFVGYVAIRVLKELLFGG
jgi:hypothetical protein